MKKIVVLLSAFLLGGAAIATNLIATSHTHNDSFTHEDSFGLDIKNEHSGGTDSRGGHNCSESSKRKGLCSGYHYH